MLNIKYSDLMINEEIIRIELFIKETLKSNPAVIGISGGLDSDVVARIIHRITGHERLKLFLVIQQNMEKKHVENARNLAIDLNVELKEIDISDLPEIFISRLSQADSEENFLPKGLIDPSRAKCSLRTPIFSTYQDRGYIVIGTSNRTEIETGFFLPFGDGIAHIKPIAHLYKSQVIQLASHMGTKQEVIDQPASAGFWEGETDLEDLAYWLYNKGPIKQERNFSKEADNEVYMKHHSPKGHSAPLALASV
jgi:NAD+ synthase